MNKVSSASIPLAVSPINVEPREYKTQKLNFRDTEKFSKSVIFKRSVKMAQYSGKNMHGLKSSLKYLV